MNAPKEWITPGGPRPNVVGSFGLGQYAGALIPEQTRTPPSATGLLSTFSSNGGIARRMLGKMLTPKQKVKIYQISQDHARRPGQAWAMKAPGAPTRELKMRTDSFEVKALAYGLHARMTADDIAEADDGLDVEFINQNAIADALDLELELQFTSFATTAANYATGHTSAASQFWDGVNADIVTDIQTARNAIKMDCLGIPMGYELVLAVPRAVYDVMENDSNIVAKWVARMGANPQAGPIPSAEFVANAIGVDRIEVSEMAAGEALETTSLPVLTSNAYAWPASNDTAVLWAVNPQIGVMGSVPWGHFTCAAAVGRYERASQMWTGLDDTADQSGPVRFTQVLDEWAITPIAVDNGTDKNMVAGYLLTDVLT